MKIGIVGYGHRIRHVMEAVVKVDPGCTLAAVADPRHEQLRQERAAAGEQEVAFFPSVEEMLEGLELDGVMIGTRDSLHAALARPVLAAGLPLFLEKPVATSMADLQLLKEAYERSDSPVVVSFPLRLSPVVKAAKRVIDSGQIGTVEHVQAVNNVPYGRIYFQSWYRDVQETGGLFLQKATHDFDYINLLTGGRPVAVCAMTSKRVFTGDKPAGLRCVDCAEQDVCPESYPLQIRRGEIPEGELCCFAVDAGNEDSGSAIVRYESGMHVSYSQNFVVRHAAGLRQARLIGYKGTLTLDFGTNEVTVVMHQRRDASVHRVDPGSEGHSGGDVALAQNFVDVMKGREPSHATLDDGLLSALMCLKARESASSNSFQEISW